MCRGVADAWFEPEDPRSARLSQQSHLDRRASPVEPMVVAALCQPTPKSSQTTRRAMEAVIVLRPTCIDSIVRGTTSSTGLGSGWFYICGDGTGMGGDNGIAKLWKRREISVCSQS
eukprot:COSAG01_NODE_1337_length_10667_cov_77.938115_3_plen_116_part_00